MNGFILWLSGVSLLAVCLFIHVLGLITVARIYFWEQIHLRRKQSIFFATITFSIAAFLAACLHTIEAGIWSLLYLYVDAMPDFITSVSFSVGAFTTYGTSGFTIAKKFVLLSEIQSMNGEMAFGLTAAFLFTLALRLHHND